MGCFSSKLESSNLEKTTYDNTEVYIPKFKKCKCVKVYDGDTLHVTAEMDGRISRFMIRMYGYDSPEIRTKNPKEKEDAYKAKKALEDRVLNKIVDIKILPIHEKYGRLLATLHDSDGESINDWMMKNGYGVPYSGGTKEKLY